MFLSTPDETYRPPLSTLAVVSLMIAGTGPLVIVSFPVGVVLAHIALHRIKRAKRRGHPVRGRGFALSALWFSYAFIGFFAVAAAVFIAAGIAPPA